MQAKTKQSSIRYAGRGLTSSQVITVEAHLAEPGHGIVFELKADDGYVKIPATCANVVNTMRNVVLGGKSESGKIARLCIVEHFLCAVSLWGLDNLRVVVDGPEMPLADGSANFWLDLFAEANWQRQIPEPHIELSEPIICQKGDRILMAIPDQTFSLNYMIDWNHPAIGKRWGSWTHTQDPRDISDARTFGPLKEHQMLGLADQVVSLTETGFSMPLRFEDEPVRHKLLDLMGDLALSGVNPINFKARFISIKAGHELDVDMAKRLIKLVK